MKGIPDMLPPNRFFSSTVKMRGTQRRMLVTPQKMHSTCIQKDSGQRDIKQQKN